MPCLLLDSSAPGGADPFFARLEERRALGLDAGSAVQEKTRTILEAVRTRGLEAVLEYNRLHDAPAFRAEQFYLGPEALAGAERALQPELRAALLRAAENIRAFHREQKEKSWLSARPDGTVLGQILRPVRRAGLYVPGGKAGSAPLVSSLLMTAIPAQVAGVEELIAVSPPGPDGAVNPVILGAAGLLGLDGLYACGSAWAIGALAYGAGPLKPVEVIAGPGNIWVAAAKRLVSGRVGVDLVAGPSEIAVIADSSADPVWLAADMLSQAEHDVLAGAVCLLTDKALIAPLQEELRRQGATLPRAAEAAESLARWGGIILVRDLDEACALANRMAPEHLELMCAHPWELLPRLRAAGAIFMGRASAEALGDYYAGPNHVLPTLGTAAFSFGLSARAFMTGSNIICASRDFAAGAAADVARLARLEGLEAHARSAELRAQPPDTSGK